MLLMCKIKFGYFMQSQIRKRNWNVQGKLFAFYFYVGKENHEKIQ